MSKAKPVSLSAFDSSDPLGHVHICLYIWTTVDNYAISFTVSVSSVWLISINVSVCLLCASCFLGERVIRRERERFRAGFPPSPRHSANQQFLCMLNVCLKMRILFTNRFESRIVFICTHHIMRGTMYKFVCVCRENERTTVHFINIAY